MISRLKKVKNDLSDNQDDKITNPVVQPLDMRVDKSPIVGNVEEARQHGGTRNMVTIKASLLTSEHLDMSSSWLAIDACLHLMIVIVMQFWALLFFDMIADVYAVINGVITMTCLAVLPALSLIALDKSDVIPRMISKVGLSHVLDRFLVNSIRLDRSRWKTITSSNRAGDDYQASSASNRVDVEMTMTSCRIMINSPGGDDLFSSP
jgi:hypothetical protein